MDCKPPDPKRVTTEVAQACHIAVKKALKAGTIARGPCAVCGNPRAVAHHEDYDKPLEIVWLCGKHHRRRHVDIGRPLVYGSMNLRAFPHAIKHMIHVQCIVEGIHMGEFVARAVVTELKRCDVDGSLIESAEQLFKEAEEKDFWKRKAKREAAKQ